MGSRETVNKTMTENKANIESTETTEIVETVDLNDPALYFNRELSLLEFNDRVLAQA